LLAEKAGFEEAAEDVRAFSICVDADEVKADSQKELEAHGLSPAFLKK